LSDVIDAEQVAAEPFKGVRYGAARLWAELAGFETKLFVRLNASARISSECRSRMWKIRERAMSISQNVGATTLFQPRLPKLPSAGRAKELTLKQG